MIKTDYFWGQIRYHDLINKKDSIAIVYVEKKIAHTFSSFERENNLQYYNYKLVI